MHKIQIANITYYNVLQKGDITLICLSHEMVPYTFKVNVSLIQILNGWMDVWKMCWLYSLI